MPTFNGKCVIYGLGNNIAAQKILWKNPPMPARQAHPKQDTMVAWTTSTSLGYRPSNARSPSHGWCWQVADRGDPGLGPRAPLHAIGRPQPRPSTSPAPTLPA